jgi:Ca2+-binding RTX toxin-like protein
MHQSHPARPAAGRTVRAGVLAAAIAAAAVATAPQAASAATVSQSGGVVTYQASPGEVNQVFPFVENGFVRVRETNQATPLAAGAGCRIVSDRIAQCDGSGARVNVNLGDRDDVYYGTGAGLVPATVNAGDGDDVLIDGDGAARREIYSGGTGVDTAAYFLENRPVALSLDGAANDGEAGEGDLVASDVENLTGGAERDTLTGNAADNHLRGERGDDRLSGAGGADTFEEGPTASGADVIAGGSGTDRVRYEERTAAGVRVTLDGTGDDGQAGERDNVQPDVENISGTRFADTLLGSDLANSISGLGGNDGLNPLGGSDRVFGGDGDDRINVRDGVRDLARGSAGTDTFTRDTVDDVIA